MKELAFIYDGQGAQTPGMGKDLYEAYPAFRETMDAVDPDGSIRELCFNGTEEQLADTRNTQPCMVAVEVSITALLADAGIEPAIAYGLSLGEYAALAAAGVFEPRQAVELVAFRGQVMDEAARAFSDCGMAAVLGADPSSLEALCAQVEAEGLGFVAVTNYNCPGQQVISGEGAAVEAACARAKEATGAKRCIPLAVSGPFHTRLMAPAGERLRERFVSETFAPARIPVLHNTTARALDPVLDAGLTVADILVDQVQQPIHFDRCMENMLAAGITTTVEIGMGKSLSKFVKKASKEAETLAVFDCESFESVKEALNG